jgi:hypothetical protein
MGHPRGCGRSWRQQRLLRENSLGTLIPPKSPPTPPTRSGHARNGHTNQRLSRERPTSSPGPSTYSPGARHRSASESAESTKYLRTSDPTLGQCAQRTPSLSRLVLDQTSNIDFQEHSGHVSLLAETNYHFWNQNFIFVSLSPSFMFFSRPN